MAEVFGVVASGISVASLAIQIVENLNKVISFYESIREAPTDIQRILIELQIFSNIVSAIQLVHDKHSLPESSEATTKKCLDLVRHDISKLSGLSLDLERKLNSDKRITRTWARVQTVLSEKKIAKLRGHLERAKGGLQLLQCCHIFEDLRVLNSLSSQTPKELGHSWETDQLEDHVKVDDGLEKPFYLPLDLCLTPEDFIRILSHKYKSRKLPGLSQIQQGHLGVFDWSENIQINSNNWKSTVKGGRGIKLAFIMSYWHGPPRSKCVRCFKPNGQNTPRRRSKCSSCGLELHRVEPDAIPFETADVTMGLSPNEYRDYQLASRKKKATQRNSHFALEQETTPVSTGDITYDNPPIDLACRRLIIKWEPIWNFVHRYLHCRCVIRLSTPSHIEKELTLLVLASCPRHNTEGVCHQDYGEIDYHQDQYFKPFGGYHSFQAFIYCFAPNIYEILGGERFLPGEQIEDALKALNEFRERDEEGLRKVFSEYIFEVNDKLENLGFELSESITEAIRDERLRRRNAEIVKNKQLGLGDFDISSLGEEQLLDLSNSPMVRELDEILDGKWSGKPHWAIED